MQQYVKDYLKSRWLTEFDFLQCEYPDCWNAIEKPHHINCCYRGKRKHKKDWSDLAWLCVEHHVRAHQNNNYETRKLLLAIAKEKIIV